MQNKQIKYAVYQQGIHIEDAYFNVYIPNANLYTELNERIEKRYPGWVNINHSGKAIKIA